MPRPLIPIDEDQVFKLAEKLWTNVAIAAFFDVHVDTLTHRFSEILAKGRQAGKMMISDGLMSLAARGNLGALIWLSKQHLGHADKVETKAEVKNDTKQVFKVQWLDEDDGISTPNGAQNNSPEKNQPIPH